MWKVRCWRWFFGNKIPIAPSAAVTIHLAATSAFTETIHLNDPGTNIIHRYGFPVLLDYRKSAAHRAKSRERGRLKAKVEPLLI